MRTKPVKHMDDAIQVEERELKFPDMHGQAALRRHLADFGDGPKFTHHPVWPPAAGGFFFHGMSGNFAGAFIGGVAGLASCNSGSITSAAPGGPMLSRQDEMRACNP